MHVSPAFGTDCYFQNCLFSLFCMTGKYPKLTVMLGNKISLVFAYQHHRHREQRADLLQSIGVQTHASLSVCSTGQFCPAPTRAVEHGLAMDITSGTFCTPEGAEGNCDHATNASNSS